MQPGAKPVSDTLEGWVKLLDGNSMNLLDARSRMSGHFMTNMRQFDYYNKNHSRAAGCWASPLNSAGCPDPEEAPLLEAARRLGALGPLPRPRASARRRGPAGGRPAGTALPGARGRRPQSLRRHRGRRR
ncbi:unnamed protein product, partial [Prorocentrum cordatum]